MPPGRKARAWLVSNPRRTTYAADHTDDTPVSLRLRLPAGDVDASGMGYGKMVVRLEGQPSLEMWDANRQGPLVVSKALASKVILNGEDVTSRMEAVDGPVLAVPARRFGLRCEVLEKPVKVRHAQSFGHAGLISSFST